MFSATPHTRALDVLDAAPPGGIRRRDLDGDAVFVVEKKPRSTRTRSRKRNNRTRFAVVPVRGEALVFDHLCLHEGVEVSSGVKYAVRTDVIFR